MDDAFELGDTRIRAAELLLVVFMTLESGVQEFLAILKVL
jgi:hypothetical protein